MPQSFSENIYHLFWTRNMSNNFLQTTTSLISYEMKININMFGSFIKNKNVCNIKWHNSHNIMSWAKWWERKTLLKSFNLHHLKYWMSHIYVFNIYDRPSHNNLFLTSSKYTVSWSGLFVFNRASIIDIRESHEYSMC